MDGRVEVDGFSEGDEVGQCDTEGFVLGLILG